MTRRENDKKIWTSRQGGQKFLDKPPREKKIFGIGQYFFKSLKPDFFNVLWCFGHFKFLGPRGGGETFWTHREGGAKNFGRVIWILDFLESLGKIKGHV